MSIDNGSSLFLANLKTKIRESTLAKEDFKTNVLKILYSEVEISSKVEPAIESLISGNEKAIRQITSVTVTDAIKARVEELNKQNEIYSEFLPKKLTESELIQVLKDNNLEYLIGSKNKRNISAITNLCKEKGLNVDGKMASQLVMG